MNEFSYKIPVIKKNLKQNIYLHIQLIICKYRTIFVTYKVYIH